MNGDVATVNNDELSDIQYIKCTYYWIRSKRINVYGHACTWLRDRRITWDDTITLQHENTTTKPIITNIDISTVTQLSENVEIRVIMRTVIVQRALEALERYECSTWLRMEYIYLALPGVHASWIADWSAHWWYFSWLIFHWSFAFAELNVSRTGSLKWRKSSIRFVFVCSLERPSSD